MILSDVFERFSRDAPLSVMAQGIMEDARNPQILDQLFEDVAEKQFTNTLLSSTIGHLMSVVVCRIRPSIHAASGRGPRRSGPRSTPPPTSSTAPNPPCRPRWSIWWPRGWGRSSARWGASGPDGCPATACGSSTGTTSPGPSTGSRGRPNSRVISRHLTELLEGA
jgi:hypothetical protein